MRTVHVIHTSSLGVRRTSVRMILLIYPVIVVVVVVVEPGSDMLHFVAHRSWAALVHDHAVLDDVEPNRRRPVRQVGGVQHRVDHHAAWRVCAGQQLGRTTALFLSWVAWYDVVALYWGRNLAGSLTTKSIIIRPIGPFTLTSIFGRCYTLTRKKGFDSDEFCRV